MKSKTTLASKLGLDENRDLHVAYDSPEFCLFYEQYGCIKVCHYMLHTEWSVGLGRRFKEAVRETCAKLGEPLFAALFHTPQHGAFQSKLYRWLGFRPFWVGEYDGAECTYYVRLRDEL